MYCWNIGGKPIESAIAAIVNSHMNVEKAIFAFQELPREPPGWRTKVDGRSTLWCSIGERTSGEGMASVFPRVNTRASAVGVVNLASGYA